MKKNYELFAKVFKNEFEFTDEKNTIFVKPTKRYYNLKKVKINEVPNSKIFDNFELVGIYNKDYVKFITFNFLCKIENIIHVFKFENRGGNVYFSKKYTEEGKGKLSIGTEKDAITLEFLKYKDFIIEQIKNSPSERLINLLQRNSI